MHCNLIYIFAPALLCTCALQCTSSCALAPAHCYALLTVHFYALQPHLHICTRTFMHFLCTCSALSVHFFALRFGQFGLVLCTVTHFNALPFHSAGTHFCALLYSQGHDVPTAAGNSSPHHAGNSSPHHAREQ